MQMPYYIKCFQSPTFVSGPLSGGCEALHKLRTSSLVHPTDVFRQQATVQIDVSPCAFYLNSTAVGGADGALGMELMLPFEVKLRPNSTDHDVFLQACSLSPAFLSSRTMCSLTAATLNTHHGDQAATHIPEADTHACAATHASPCCLQWCCSASNPAPAYCS